MTPPAVTVPALDGTTIDISEQIKSIGIISNRGNHRHLYSQRFYRSFWRKLHFHAAPGAHESVLEHLKDKISRKCYAEMAGIWSDLSRSPPTHTHYRLPLKRVS